LGLFSRKSWRPRDRFVNAFDRDRRSRQVYIAVNRASAPPKRQTPLGFLHEFLSADRSPTRGHRCKDRPVVLHDAGMAKSVLTFFVATFTISRNSRTW